MQSEDFKWFIKNYKMLFNRYGVSYLAIKNKRVLGCYSSYSDGVHETLRTEEIGTFIVQECNGDESAYTINIASLYI